MTRIPFSNTGTTPFERLMGHNPQVLQKWDELERALFAAPLLSPELKEQVRRTLAFGNGCEYCMAKGRPADVHPDPKQSLAVAFAQMVVQDHLAIDDRQFDVLRVEFNDAEIAELCAFICFITASQSFGALLNLTPASSV